MIKKKSDIKMSVPEGMEFNKKYTIDHTLHMEKEMDQVIEDLEKQGLNQISHIANYKQIGLGDVVESTLKKFGVTEDRFKKWFNLEECDCTKRKKWLNKLFTWHYKNYKG